MTKTEIEKALSLATPAQLAAALGAKRRVHAGGRPKKLRRCEKCGARLGVREMLKHECAAPMDKVI